MRRRDFIGGAIGATLAAAPERPNIVYVLTDDLGYGDVHCLNPERGRIPTPHLDRFASEGMTFTDAHSGSAVCTPTRYGILTGRYAWRSRLQSGVLGPYGEALIPRERATVAGMLRAHGYATACIGKWHLGWSWPKENGQPIFDRPIADGPTTNGFDLYFGTDVPNYPPYCFIENDRTVGIPSVPKPPEMYGSPGIMLPGWKLEGILPALVQRAVGWIREQAAARKPFFLYLPLTSPHTPLAIAEEWKGKSGLGMYGDWVMQTDWSIGRILRALDETGAARNTLVIVTSDNGCAPYVGVTAQHGSGRVKELEARGHYPSAGFRGYKSDIWEGGHRVPFFARWPGVVKAGSRCDATICLTDFLATCAEILGVRLDPSQGEDSVSILGRLLGRQVKPREAVVHHSIYGRFAIRQDEWKLILAPGSGGWSSPRDHEAVEAKLPPVQLYNLLRDPSETENLYDKEPRTVRRLIALLEHLVAEGRSTAGPRQSNDVAVDIWKGTVYKNLA